MTNGTRRGWGVSVMPGRSLLSGKTWYPLYRRLGGPQGRSGQVQKISPPPGFDPQTVQPVASHYTDWATRPTVIVFTSLSKCLEMPNSIHYNIVLNDFTKLLKCICLRAGCLLVKVAHRDQEKKIWCTSSSWIMWQCSHYAHPPQLIAAHPVIRHQHESCDVVLTTRIRRSAANQRASGTSLEFLHFSNVVKIS